MSKLAKKLIAENMRTKDKFLDLGSCGLKALPAELGELVWLESLVLSDLWLTQDDNGWQLQGSDNSGRSNAQLSSLAALAPLKGLRTLFVRDTQVADLSPLSGLLDLEIFDAQATRVVDLSPLSGLHRLQMLKLGKTKVLDLSPLSRLFCLKNLDISDTKVVDLSPLSGLHALRYLDFEFTAVFDLTPLQSLFDIELPMRWDFMDYDKIGIRVQGCPLTKPPVEIARQGIGATLNYFRETAAGAVDHLYEAKMLILGEGGAGKTSLLRRLYQPELALPGEQETTKGIDIHRIEFPLPNGKTFRLNVWDFGGQEIYHATHQFFLTRRSLYLLVDDTRKSHKLVSDAGFKDWLDLIALFGGDSPVLLFQNEKGGRSKEIDLDGVQERYANVKKCYQGNLEHQQSAATLRQGIESYAGGLQHIGEELPASWIKVRAELEQRANHVPHISQQEYFEIYQQFLPFDRVKALHLSRYLHDLGVFLHFQDDPLLARTVILQNAWATEAVYRILDDEKIKDQAGSFTSTDCARLWHDSIYADMHPELLALMERFELCYILPHNKPRAWLAPQLLPASKPLGLRDWGQASDLALHYHYDIMPKGIINRLVVRLHRFLPDPEQASIACVLFEHDGSAVLAEQLASGNKIALRARGPMARALLNVVASELDAINHSFSGLDKKVGKWIACHCPECLKMLTPHLFEEKELRRRLEKNRPKVECRNSFDEVDVAALLDGLRFEALPGWAKEEKPAALRTVKIFLASSRELLPERDAFELYFRQQNDRYMTQGFYLEVVRWENFFNAMSATRLQDEYNKALCGCDVFVSLFSTKTGKYATEEFDAAYRQFTASGRPYIFTFFKDAEIRTGDVRREDLQALWAFQDKLKALGHYPTKYKDSEDLKLQFANQLDRLLAPGKLG